MPASRESIFSMTPTLSPARSAMSTLTLDSKLVEFNPLEPPVGEAPVLLLEVKEVAKVVGVPLGNCAGCVHSGQMPGLVALV